MPSHGEDRHLDLVLRRNVPKLIILDAEYRIASAQDGVSEFFETFGGLTADDTERLPAVIELSIRRATAGWMEPDAKDAEATLVPLPQLLIRATRLSGPRDLCIAITVERISTRENLYGAADRFKLSDREISILTMLLRGNSAREIAGYLYISPNTVKEHIKRIYAKVGATSRAEAVARILDWHEG